MIPQIDSEMNIKTDSELLLPSKTYKINKDINTTKIKKYNKTKVTGEVINIKDALFVKENDASLKINGGKSTQETRSGKNKFNLAYIRNAPNFFTVTDTGVNLTNAWVADVYTFENIAKTFKSNTTYTMRVKAKVVSRPSNILYHNNAIFYFYRPSTSTLGTIGINVLLMPDKETVALDTEKEYITTFTTPEDMTDVRFVSYTFKGNNDGSTTGTTQGEIDVSEIMLVEGTYTAENFPDFELYGISPSPDYPSKIKSIGDEGTLNIEQSGKNKLINSSFRENWTDWWTSNNGTIPIEITEKLGQKCLHITGELQKAKTVTQSIQTRVKIGKTYTLSCMAYLKDYVAGTTNPIISFYTDGKTTDGSWTSGIQTLKGYLNFNNSNYDYSKGFVKMTSTFKIKDDTDLTKTLGLYVYARDFTGDLYVYDVQLEETTEATDYEEYFHNTYTLPLSEPLRSLPNGVKDTPENDDIHRFINHRIFDGSNDEKWYIGKISSDTAKTDIYIVLLDDNYNQGIGVSILSDYFENKVVWNTDTEGIYLQANNGALMVRINKDRLENPGTTPSFKKWLSQNPITVQYQARTEKIENYTEEQQAVIDELNNFQLIEGTNIIEVLGDVKPNLTLEYYDSNNIALLKEQEDRILGYIDGVESIKQSAYHILSTERYSCLIYDENYGVEFEQYIGQSLEFVEASIKETLQEALTQDERILGVEITNIEKTKSDCVTIKFIMNCDVGDIEMEVDINE